MDFEKAVKKTPNLEEAYRTGLQALRAQDRPHIRPQSPQRLAGSVDIDAALQQVDPHGNRWDFAIGYKHTNRDYDVVYWVEIHTASDSEVKVVLRKAEWLLNWLKDDGKALKKFEREIIWVSSGRTSFTLSAPQRRQMAERGLTHRGLVLEITNRRRD